MLIPATVVEKAELTYGAEGLAWAAALPETLAACRRRWQIEDVQVFEGLSFGYVARVRRRHVVDAVLKLTYPWGEEALLQPLALRAFEGRACVRLLDEEPALGAMLLELIEPATSAVDLEEDEATRTLAGVMRSLRGCRPPEGHAF